jgi:preprotein translocase subunit SecA
LNALAGHGVHVVTVNDYLAKRDAEWMGKIYEFLGLTVGVIVHDLDDGERRAAYAADITYGTNNEFGFDYLRDNMKFELKDCVQRGHYYAIVDEVDSILIDEARTPLIISGPTDQTTDKYARVRKIMPQLELGEEIECNRSPNVRKSSDMQLERARSSSPATTLSTRKQRTIGVTDEGWETIEKLLGIGNIADAENWELKHYVETAIKAHALYKRDVEYVVKDGEVIIVDTFTGRLMPGRRWSDGLHQSIEAKEGVSIRKEDQTLATITFQNYFRLYKKLSGMTGTAETEAAEFEKIYKLEIVVIPTNKPMRRLGKLRRGLPHGERKSTKRLPTTSRTPREEAAGAGRHHVDRKERAALRHPAAQGRAHVVLNAKFHEREAEIVAQAGRLGIGDHLHQHGRPRHRYSARRQSLNSWPARSLVKKGNARAISVNEGAINPMAPAGFLRFYYQGQEFEVSEPEWAEAFKGTRRRRAEPITSRSSKSAASSSSAPSATSRAASTTSCAAAPAARAIPASRASISRSKTT